MLQAVRRGMLKKSEYDRGAKSLQISSRVADFGGERRKLERRIVELERETERLRAVRPVKYAAAPRLRRGPDDFLRVQMPDSHGMYAAPEAIAAFLTDLAELNPHSFIGTGDHTDCGGFLSQHHTLGYVAQGSYTYEQDIAATNALLDAIHKAAPRAAIELMEGNHEQRVERWCIEQALRNGADAEGLRLRNAPEYLLHLKERGIPYRRMADFHDGLPVRGVIRRGKCFFVHAPPQGCPNPGAVARKFGGCVVFGHTHRAVESIVRTVSTDAIGAFNSGCLCEIQPLYGNTDVTDWSHGYGLQIVARSGAFLHINVPIIAGVSLLRPLLKGMG